MYKKKSYEGGREREKEREREEGRDRERERGESICVYMFTQSPVDKDRSNALDKSHIHEAKRESLYTKLYTGITICSNMFRP